MAVETARQFIELLRRSELVEPRKLDDYLGDLRNKKIQIPGASQLAQMMVRDGIITPFHAENLLAGKWNGFRLGNYTILEHIGSGGMGAVYLAEHRHMKRAVALKVMPQDRSKDRAAVARFYREAKAVGAVDHPNIIRAHDMDQAGAVHFLVMEFVHGSSLQELVKLKGPMPAPRAAHYISQAAQGLQHVHEMGLIHRDIKPNNLLVDRNGTVKLLDLGLARITNDKRDNITRVHDETVMGTADYISPEQALDSHTVDIRADIYSLGCTFYFLLTGKPPFHEGSSLEKIVWHQKRPPRPVSEFRKDVPAPLIDVLNRMLHKDPKQRYQTPQEVVNALAAFTRKPIAAPREDELPRLSPASRACLATSLRRKTTTNKTRPGGGGGFGKAALGVVRFGWRSVAGTVGFFYRHYTPRRALAAGACLGVLGVALFFGLGGIGKSDPTKPELSGNKDRYGDPLPVGARARLGTTRFHTPGSARSAAISPDGTKVAAAIDYNQVIVWDSETGKVLKNIESQTPDFYRIAFSNDGKILAAADREHNIAFWDWAEGSKPRKLRGHLSSINYIEFAPTGNLLVTVSSDRTARVWNTSTDSTVHVFNTTTSYYRAVFAPDGKTIALSSSDRAIRVCNATDGNQICEIKGKRGYSYITFVDDGKTLAAGDTSEGVLLWDASSGKQLPTLPNSKPASALIGAGKGPVLASWYSAQPLRLWDVNTRKVLFTLEEKLPRYPTAYSFSADGSKLIFVDSQLAISIWSTSTGKLIFRNDGHTQPVRELAFAGDGKSLASTGADNAIRFWNVADGTPLYEPIFTTTAANSVFGFTDAAGKQVALGSGSSILFFDADSGSARSTRNIRSPALSALGTLAPDGKQAAITRINQNLMLVSMDKGAALHTFADAKPLFPALAYSRDGKRLVASCQDGVRVWNLAAGNKLEHTFNASNVFLLALSRDGKLLAGIDNRNIKLWDIENGKKLIEFDTTDLSLSTIAFSPDGNTVVCGDDSGYLYFWKRDQAKHVHYFRAHLEGITALVFSPDGKTLATGSKDTTILLWNAEEVLAEAR